MISIEIVGDPIPWQRPGRCMISGNVITYDKQRKLKEQTQWQVKGQYRETPLTTALRVDILFFMAMPKSSKKKREQMLLNYIKPMKRPDIDNLQKYVLDCLTGIIYNDDAQIVELFSRKVYTTQPRTVVRICPFTCNPDVVIEDPDNRLSIDQYI